MITADTLDQQLTEEAKTWELPVVGETNVDDGKTNAINRSRTWKYEPPEEEVEILPPTAEEIEAIRQEAHAEGFEQGKQEGTEQGYQEGLARGQEEGLKAGQEAGHTDGLKMAAEHVAEQLNALQQVMDKLHDPIESVQQELQRELVALSVGLARSVIKQEVKTNPDVIFQALAEGLKVLPVGEKSYQISMNPEDIQLIKTQFSDDDIARHKWVLIESPTLSRGGCDITTESNSVDLTIERRCRDVLDKFLHEQGLSAEVPTE